MTRVTGIWLESVATQTVMQMLEEAGFQALAVGGCVRNALLGVPVVDVDISTDARPEKVIALAEAAGLRALPTGIDHGTVTVVAEGEPFEITTFRADVATDGRRAVVQFADNVAKDAVRRDFTMNALYADRRGALADPLGGLPDLQARRLRFIQDPARRIREDYLRILRYFRFFAWYADASQGFDPDALAAIATHLDGLSRLSRERVGAEMVKLLGAPNPVMAVAGMAQTGVLTTLLPGAVPDALGPLVHIEDAWGLAPDPMRRLGALGEVDLASLRLAKAQITRATQLRQAAIEGTTAHALAYAQGADFARDTLALRASLTGGAMPTLPDPETLQAAENAHFPIKAQDLMPALQGPALGAMLKRLETQWISSRFALSHDDLMKIVRKG